MFTVLSFDAITLEDTVKVAPRTSREFAEAHIPVRLLCRCGHEKRITALDIAFSHGEDFDLPGNRGFSDEYFAPPNPPPNQRRLGERPVTRDWPRARSTNVRF